MTMHSVAYLASDKPDIEQSENEQHRGSILVTIPYPPAGATSLRAATWTCQECGATGFYDIDRRESFPQLHPRKAPNYVNDPALMLEILARIRQWSPVRQRIFTGQLYHEIIREMDASGELDRVDIQLIARYWGFLLYLSPRTICQAALFAVDAVLD